MHVNGVVICWNCEGKLAENNFGRQDQCPGCQRETRVCKNCFFHDPLCYNECREIQAERIVDKEASNFCDFFKTVHKSAAASRPKKSSGNSPRQAAEALFKTR